MKAIIGVMALLSTGLAVRPAAAQTAAGGREHVAGTIVSVTAGSNQFALKTDAGDTITVTTNDSTVILHPGPGVTDVKQAPRMKASELAAGDKLLAYYRGAAGDKQFIATTLVVRTAADLGAISQAELADWKKRGMAGNVIAVDAAAKTITVKSGARTINVTTTDKTEFHRYSPDSAKASDAKPSSFAEIKDGDQVRVLGNRSADGTSDAAESIYAGEFRQLAATVVSVNAAGNEMQVKDLLTKKPLVIKVDSDSTLKKLDPQMAAMLARRYGAGRGQGQEGQGGPPRGEGRGPGGGEGRGFGGPGGGGRGGDIGGMIDRSPAIQLADLKAGDAVLILTTKGSDPSRVTCVQLLAGVDPILTAAPNSTRDLLGGWNLGGGAGGGEGQ